MCGPYCSSRKAEICLCVNFNKACIATKKVGKKLALLTSDICFKRASLLQFFVQLWFLYISLSLLGLAAGGSQVLKWARFVLFFLYIFF